MDTSEKWTIIGSLWELRRWRDRVRCALHDARRAARVWKRGSKPYVGYRSRVASMEYTIQTIDVRIAAYEAMLAADHAAKVRRKEVAAMLLEPLTLERYKANVVQEERDEKHREFIRDWRAEQEPQDG